MFMVDSTEQYPESLGAPTAGAFSQPLKPLQLSEARARHGGNPTLESSKHSYAINIH